MLQLSSCIIAFTGVIASLSWRESGVGGGTKNHLSCSSLDTNVFSHVFFSLVALDSFALEDNRTRMGFVECALCACELKIVL